MYGVDYYIKPLSWPVPNAEATPSSTIHVLAQMPRSDKFFIIGFCYNLQIFNSIQPQKPLISWPLILK